MGGMDSPQPETAIAVVGHSQFFKAMLNLDFKFGNCDVWQVELSLSDGDQEESKTTSEPYPLPRQSSNLERLYECDLQETN